MTVLIGYAKSIDNIEICKKCNAVLEYNTRDVRIWEYETYDSDYVECTEYWKAIECICCGNLISTEKIRRKR